MRREAIKNRNNRQIEPERTTRRAETIDGQADKQTRKIHAELDSALYIRIAYTRNIVSRSAEKNGTVNNVFARHFKFYATGNVGRLKNYSTVDKQYATENIY